MTMRAVTLPNGFGDVSKLVVSTGVPLPKLTSSHPVLVRVSHSALNRADLMQRMGRYPPPPGASDILGLECCGEVVEVAEQNLCRKQFFP